jgi:putative flippase GtrA
MDIPAIHPAIKRWLIFNSVGAMGIVVQTVVLFALTTCAGINYLAATGLAVEAAVLHNFFWHERWTWADRNRTRVRLLRRLLAFHLANGAFSIAGNLLLMRFFVGKLGVNFMFANALSIALCSIFNFLAGDCIVFRNPRTDPAEKSRGRRRGSSGTAALLFLCSLLILAFGSGRILAADLQPETAKAWLSAVDKTERRISAELTAGQGFFALEFQDPRTAAKERSELLSGEIPVRRVSEKDDAIPDGMIHHWRGSVFIPGITLDYVLSRVENPRPEDSKQEDVLDSRVLDKSPGHIRMYLKLQRSKIVTVVYNTEHLVRFRRCGNGRAFSSSTATRIAEIENFRESTEREKPEGHDHGYLWRMNSYWRYEEIKGGVLVECESMTLSRSIPSLLEFMVRPLINSVARESMKRTLESMRTRMTRGFRAEAAANL